MRPGLWLDITSVKTLIMVKGDWPSKNFTFRRGQCLHFQYEILIQSIRLPILCDKVFINHIQALSSNLREILFLYFLQSYPFGLLFLYIIYNIRIWNSIYNDRILFTRSRLYHNRVQSVFPHSFYGKGTGGLWQRCPTERKSMPMSLFTKKPFTMTPHVFPLNSKSVRLSL